MLKYITILLLLCSFAKRNAQEPIRYTTKQGLPTNHVYDMVEDSNGFIWFATKQGVVKYDGEIFKIFTIQDGLPNNDTWKLETDRQGRIWYFSKSKYQGYIKNDSVYKYPIKEGKVISPRATYKIKDTIWMQSGLGMYTLKDSVFVNEFDRFIQSEKIKMIDTIYSGFFKGYYFLPLKHKFISWVDKQFIIVDELKNKVTMIPIPFKTSISFGYNLLPNSIFIASFKEGFVLIDINNYKSKVFLFNDLINQSNIEQIRYKALKNQFQISGSGYLLIFDYNFNLIEKHLFKTTEKSVWSYKDTKGNIWQNSLSKGVTLLPNTQLHASYYLKGEKVQRVGLFNSKVFAGIQNKGFYQFDENQNTFIKRKDLPSYGNIYHIKKDEETQSSYLISANNSYILNKGKNMPISAQVRLPDHRESKTTWFKDVVNFKNEIFYVDGSYLGFSAKLSNKSNVILRTGLSQLVVYNNQVYVGGSDGLSLFKNDSLVKPNVKNDLLNVSITSVTASKANLFVGTDGRGVYLYNDKQVLHLKETDGLSVQRMIKEEDTLWIASQKGVKKVVLNREKLAQSKIVDAFFDTDGLLQNNTNDIYKQDSLLFVASDIGLAKINLNSSIYKQQPKLYFKTKKDTLNFKNGERDHVAITFALQNYVNQEHVTYQYRLFPAQKEWITTQTKTLNFSNLSPKLYTLQVKATDQHNNQSISKQYLNIIPAWYQTIYSKIGFALIGIFSFLLFVNILKQGIREKEQDKAQQERRVAGLELQALRSQMNPHFVHNSLNAIQYFIQRNEVELSENYLSKFSQLIRLFFEYSRRQTITIKEELELLTNYLEIEKLRFEEKLQYKISVCEKIDLEEQLIPSMLLQPILENAVNHGLFYKKENGTVEVFLNQLDVDTYKVTVKDDGIGINKAKSVFKASSKNYQSNSSKVLYERLDLLNKSKEWTIEYSIQDISDIEVDKTGTLVTLIFKQNLGQ
ncbi:sensor histidine kinase [Yeosuana marina]|uniref:sensor histidine kinase n=1 Tax=Yeosuana marina TaxID=1565536 RepID=UPI0030C892B4